MRTHAHVFPWMEKFGSGLTILLVLLFLLGSSWTSAQAAGDIVVGNGTPESCTYIEFYQALADMPTGGTINFNCGPDPVTVYVGDVELTKDLTIDGGGLVTFTGYNVFWISSSITVHFMNFTLANSSGDTIGGIENHGTLTLQHVTVANNSDGHGYGGGGLYNDGNMLVEDSIVSGNYAGCDTVQCGDAGGIWNDGTLQVVNSTVSDNRAVGNGAGIYNRGTATIEKSTISGNSSVCGTIGWDNTVYCYEGGGIWNSGTLSLINSTVSGNSAGGNAGGIANYRTLFLRNTTIANNSSPVIGGLSNHNLSTLQNSLIAGNTKANQQPSDCSGTMTSQGYNLIGNTSGCTIDGDTTGNLLNVEPRLGPLQDNGGLTFTHALSPGSPAIDAGNPTTPGSGGTACEATDQRGLIRPHGARCDIGAVEIEGGLTVTIDIKPGDGSNPINLKSKGVIPVAILSTSTFDAATVDPSTVTFGPNNIGPAKSTLTDVNGDGRLDLLLHFSTQQTGIQKTDIQACLAGQTTSGTLIQGCDSIRIVP